MSQPPPTLDPRPPQSNVTPRGADCASNRAAVITSVLFVAIIRLAIWYLARPCDSPEGWIRRLASDSGDRRFRSAHLCDRRLSGRQDRRAVAGEEKAVVQRSDPLENSTWGLSLIVFTTALYATGIAFRLPA